MAAQASRIHEIFQPSRGHESAPPVTNDEATLAQQARSLYTSFDVPRSLLYSLLSKHKTGSRIWILAEETKRCTGIVLWVCDVMTCTSAVGRVKNERVHGKCRAPDSTFNPDASFTKSLTPYRSTGPFSSPACCCCCCSSSAASSSS